VVDENTKSDPCDNSVDDLIKFMNAAAKTEPIQHHKLLSRTEDDKIIVRHVKNELAKQFHIEIYDERDGFNKVVYNGRDKNDINALLAKYPLSDERFKIFWADSEKSILKDGARFIVPKDMDERFLFLATAIQLHEGRSISVIGLIPQYFMLTLAEVFISITALEFAYTQAPSNMRTLCTAFWYLTVTFGNLIAIGISKVQVARSVKQLIMVFCLIFGSFLYYILSKRYKVLTIEDVEIKFTHIDYETGSNSSSEDGQDDQKDQKHIVQIQNENIEKKQPPAYETPQSLRLNRTPQNELMVDNTYSNDNSTIELLKK